MSEPTFRYELQRLLNRYSRQNNSNTPDFILAGYLSECLEVFNKAVNARETFYGRNKVVAEPPAGAPKQPNEIPMKEWIEHEAAKSYISHSAVWNRIHRNKLKYYPNLVLRRVNQRVVFVQI